MSTLLDIFWLDFKPESMWKTSAATSVQSVSNRAWHRLTGRVCCQLAVFSCYYYCCCLTRSSVNVCVREWCSKETGFFALPVS